MPWTVTTEDSRDGSVYPNNFTIAEFQYAGPSQALLEMANAVMSQGTILPIAAPAANASWDLDFAGPSLKCDDVDTATQSQIRSNTIDYFTQPERTFCALGPEYMAWIPTSGWWNGKRVGNVPFLADDRNGNLEFNTGSLDRVYVSREEVLPMADQAARVYVAIMTQDAINAACYRKAQDFHFGTLFQCQLYNSTYRVSFTYKEGIPNITIDGPHTSNDTAVDTMPLVLASANYTAWPSGILPSARWFTGCPMLIKKPVSRYPQHLKDAYRIETDVLPTLSYQAIFDAFTGLIKGFVQTYGPDVTDPGSSILLTKLMNTKELAPLLIRETVKGRSLSALQGFLTISNLTAFKGMRISTADFGTPATGYDLKNATYTSSLRESIEEMFKILTSTTAPPPVEVILPRYHNVHVYSAKKLWVAYGTAIALAALAVLAGLEALMLNGASYSNNFSTVFRAARGATVSVEAREEDLDGKDLLPAYLSRSLVWLGRGDDKSKTMNESMSETTVKSGSAYQRLPPLEAAMDISLEAFEDPEVDSNTLSSQLKRPGAGSVPTLARHSS